MSILCLWFALYCTLPSPNYADIKLSVICPFESDATKSTQAAFDKADQLWWTTAPQSDAAAWSTEGARIEIDFQPGVCKISSTLLLNTHNTLISGAVLEADGEITTLSISLSD